MRYISVCSGIEAATVAWHPLGWQPVAFSEIEKFPSAVLAHHYPSVPNWGDMTKFQEWPDAAVDVLVGGTPCQSFSVAGLRKGLDDPRGNLMLTFLAIAERHRPRWIIWENVPGVLSSNKGRDFGTFLAALGELGYGWAYRVLDAQWFGVAQRRRRVFVVACLGDQASAAAVLFESESVQRNPPPSREARQGFARGVTRCFAGNSESGVAATLETTSHDYSRADGFNMVAQPIGLDEEQNAVVDGFGTLKARTEGGGFEGCVAQPVAFYDYLGSQGGGVEVGVSPTLKKKDGVAVTQPVAGSHWDHPSNPHPTLNQSAKGSGGIAASDQELFSQRGSGLVPAVGFQDDTTPKAAEERAFCLRREAGGEGACVMTPVMQVRRLTPVECERLQGFPDGYTNIPWRNKAESPDGPRYKALGNSMAVPCMKWIGERIAAQEARDEG